MSGCFYHETEPSLSLQDEGFLCELSDCQIFNKIYLFVVSEQIRRISCSVGYCLTQDGYVTAGY